MQLVHPVTHLLVGLAPIFFLTVDHWVNACYYTLFLLSLWWCLKFRPVLGREDFLPITILIAPFLAVLIAQVIRLELSLSDFDAPSRPVAAVPVYLLLREQLKASGERASTLMKSLLIGMALSLLSLPFFLDAGRTGFFGGRIATGHTDVNTLGSYIGLFLVACAFGLWRALKTHSSARVFEPRQILLIILFATAILIGLDLLLQTQSRGAWLATILGILVLLLLILRESLKQGLIWVGLLSLAIALGALSGGLDRYQARFSSILSEPIEWLKTENQSTSGGSRLSMSVATIHLVAERPWSGFSNMGYAERMQEPDFLTRFGTGTVDAMSKAGPHQEITARTLQSGVWGLGASLLLFLGPIVILANRLRLNDTRANNPVAISVALGLIVFIQIFALQFTIEPYTLKFTASFNALLLALFLSATRTQADSESFHGAQS